MIKQVLQLLHCINAFYAINQYLSRWPKEDILIDINNNISIRQNSLTFIN